MPEAVKKEPKAPALQDVQIVMQRAKQCPIQGGTDEAMVVLGAVTRVEGFFRELYAVPAPVVNLASATPPAPQTPAPANDSDPA